ncbi:hypothetical protein ACFQ77_15165 [Streptomyces virginiae]|uniref:hypothetical protein n=1 Tax=Streptomyces virginiae TaxID=1961 RepID=UPI0036C155E7
MSAEPVIVQVLDNPRLWSVAARLMTPYAKTFPGSDGAKAVHWYRMAAKAADASGDVDTRVWGPRAWCSTKATSEACGRQS